MKMIIENMLQNEKQRNNIWYAQLKSKNLKISKSKENNDNMPKTTFPLKDTWEIPNLEIRRYIRLSSPKVLYLVLGLDQIQLLHPM